MKNTKNRLEPERVSDTHAFFWNSVFSQWYTSKTQITDGDLICKNAEEYMMYNKAIVFEDFEILELMQKVKTPREVKALGRKVRGFNDKEWDKNKIDIVTKANYLKFTQNKNLYDILIKYKDYIMVEASPQDKIWGIGLHFDDDRVLDENLWQGQNLLGECIMKAREQILSNI